MNQDAIAKAVAVVGLTVLVDQATKAIAVASLERGEEVNVFLGLDMTYVRNEGVAFGALEGGGAVLVTVISLALVGLVVYFLANSDVPRLWLPVGLILGGALGNLADRARDGSVVDFIDPVAWPAFNVADACIVVGVFLLLWVVEGRPTRPRRS